MPNTNERDALPELPEMSYLGDDASYGYDASQMIDFALDAVRAATAPNAGAPLADAEEFLDAGLADVQDESGVLTYYSRSAVLECIRAALAAAPAQQAGAPLSGQQVIDRFSFLEGLVSEETYRKIADTAIEIQRAAGAPLPLAPSEAMKAEIHESEEGHIRATLRAPAIAEYTLMATREEGANWYIHVTNEGGFSCYDGYWRDSAHKSRAEVLVEAAHGCQLGDLATLQQATLPASEAVAEIVECGKMGQQTVAEIDGRWKFLPYGTKLYTRAQPQADAAEPVAKGEGS